MDKKPGNDYSRVGQIFYSEVSDQDGNNLAYFLNHCMEFYNKHYYPSARPDEIREFVFPGIDRRTYLSFLIGLRNRAGKVVGFGLEGKTEELSGLLGLLRGTLDAEFSGLTLDSLEPGYRDIAAKSRIGNVSQVGPLGLYFSANPEQANLIRKTSLQARNRINNAYKPLRLEQALGKIPLDILQLASHIGVKDSFYLDDNPNKELFHERCDITQPVEGKYHFRHRLRSASDEPLSDVFYTRTAGLFELSQASFSPISCQRMHVNDCTPAFEGDGNG